MAKDNKILNKKEKIEIMEDVKDAFNKAQNKNNLTQVNNVHKKSKIMIFITVFIILLVASSGIYWYLANNPKTIFIRSVDVVFDTLNENVKAPKNEITKGKINFDFNIKSSDNNYNKLNELDFKVDYIVDSLNNNAKNKVTIADNNNSEDITFYSEENKLYLYKDTINEKYIELDNETSYNYDSKNIKTLIKSLNEAFNTVIDNQKFSCTNTNIEINNKNIEVYKASLEINNEDIKTGLENIKKYLTDDNRFLTSYSNIYNIEKKDVPFQITKKISALKTKYFNTDNMIINIYTKGVDHEFIKLEILQNTNNKLDTISVTKIKNNKYEYLIDNQNENIKQEGIVSYKENDNKTTYNISWAYNTKTNNTQSDIKITITENQASTFKKEDVKDIIKYTELSSEQRNTINSALTPIKTIINLITNNQK